MITIDIQCIVCNEIHFIQVREDDYQKWESGELVQRAFPYLNAADREAVREYIDNHREEINQRVLAALGQLDGTKAAAVSFATGLSRARIDELGGIEE